MREKIVIFLQILFFGGFCFVVRQIIYGLASR
jgi:hypothetical protein